MSKFHTDPVEFENFVWDAYQNRLSVYESSPLEQLIKKEEKGHLLACLNTLAMEELTVIMKVNYLDEDSPAPPNDLELCKYFSRKYGMNVSRYKVMKYYKSGLSKMKSRLVRNYGWEI